MEFSERQFSEFLVARRDECGFPDWKAFGEASNVSPATIYRILGEPPIEYVKPATALSSRANFARGLKFADWQELVEAWRAFGVMHSDLPREIDIASRIVDALRFAATEGRFLHKGRVDELDGLGVGRLTYLLAKTWTDLNDSARRKLLIEARGSEVTDSAGRRPSVGGQPLGSKSAAKSRKPKPL